MPSENRIDRIDRDPASPSREVSALPMVSVVAPVYNEAATLNEFVERLVKAARALESRYRFEFVLVDDGSTDGTLKLARQLIASEPRLRVVELRRNFGQTAALQAGLAASTGDVVVSMDADLQHFPEDLPVLLDRLEEGYDLVCGWRHDRQEGVLRRWPSNAANALIRAISGLAVHDIGTTYRAYRSDLVRQLQLLGEQHRFVPVLASLVGARVTEVKIRNIERPAGASNYGLGRTVNVFLDILYLYFSRYYFTRPLKAFGKIGLLLILTGVLISGSLVAYSLVTGIPTIRERGGWFLLSSLLMLGGLQTLLTGIVAEILVRVYYQSGQTQQAYVRREWNRDSMGL
jgi:glycosyltransferase involved in cell wall biosynthesis